MHRCSRCRRNGGIHTRTQARAGGWKHVIRAAGALGAQAYTSGAGKMAAEKGVKASMSAAGAASIMVLTRIAAVKAVGAGIQPCIAAVEDMGAFWERQHAEQKYHGADGELT